MAISFPMPSVPPVTSATLSISVLASPFERDADPAQRQHRHFWPQQPQVVRRHAVEEQSLHARSGCRADHGGEKRHSREQAFGGEGADAQSDREAERKSSE